MSKHIKQPEGLISVLLDYSAEFGDRDDAAMDLGAFDGPDVEKALLKIVCNKSEDENIIDRAAESLSEVWARSGEKGFSQIDKMHPTARKYFEKKT